jgi:osmotically-inducible protein OsmY
MAEAMIEAVRRAFRQEPRLGPAFELACIAAERDGALCLEGEVASLAQKKLALQRAAAVPGSAGIVDRIRIAAPPMSDRQIRARLRDMFAQDRDFSDFEVREDVSPGELKIDYRPVAGAGGQAHGRLDIEVEQGVVTFNGSAPSLVRKRLAGALAWRVAGVRDVVNGLEVRPSEEDNSDQIEEAVRVVLEHNVSVDASQIKVGVSGAMVRLTGLVHTDMARAAAEADAWAVFGVDDVINEIEVRA